MINKSLTRRQFVKRIMAATGAAGAALWPPPLAELQAATSGASRIPILHTTDLLHPYDDPDDHYDLATLLAMPEFDIKGIILDQGDRQAKRPGVAAIKQMIQITGRNSPYAIGLSQPLRNRQDTALEEPETFQGGVRLILNVLRDSSQKVVLHAAGSCRDLTAAYNRAPELFREKVRAVYIEIGNGPGGDQDEYNVKLDPFAYVRLIESNLPLYWCPCFGKDGFQTFFTVDQPTILTNCAQPVQNYFVYCLTKSKEDPLDFLKSGPHPLPQGPRNMWCTAPLLHAAGRRLYQQTDGGFVALPPAVAEKQGLIGKEIEAFQYQRVLAKIERDPQPGRAGSQPIWPRLSCQLNVPLSNSYIFHATHPRYPQILASALKNLLAGLGK